MQRNSPDVAQLLLENGVAMAVGMVLSVNSWYEFLGFKPGFVSTRNPY